MSRDSTKQFPLLADQAGGDETPYDTYYQRSLYDQMSILTQHGGSDLTHVFQNGQPEGVQVDFARPLCSATGYVTVHMVPVYISDGLSSLHISHNVSVGIGGRRADQVPPALMPDSGGISIKYTLASDPSRDDFHTILGTNSDNPQYWDFKQRDHEFDVSFAQEGWDLLVISMRSLIPENYLKTDQYFQGASWDIVPDGVIDHANINGAGSQDLHTGNGHFSAAPLYEHTGTVAGQLNSTDTDIMASILITLGASTVDEPLRLKIVDHMGRGDSDTIFVHPANEDLKNDEYDRVAKCWIPYGVWRSISIREEYETPSYPSIASLRSNAVAAAAPYRALRRGLRQALTRPRLLSAGHHWAYPDTGDDWWGDNGYRLRHPFISASQDSGSTIPIAAIPPYVDGEARIRLMVAGLYEGFDMSAGTGTAPATYEDWDEALEAGCEALVDFGGQERMVKFASLGRSEGNHFLQQKLTQIVGGNGGCRELSFREGLLDEKQDWGIWQNIDVPLSALGDLDIAFINDPALSEIDWLDGVQTDLAGTTVGGDHIPDVNRCYLFILGYSVHWFSGDEDNS